MYDSEGQSEGLPKSSFPIYVAEGDVLFKQGEYEKALDSYSTALEIEPSDKNCLVARSKCHLKLGDAKAALKDAEASLEDDQEFNKGLYQKAEALYQSGDFEMSLVFYHRGNKLRPELQEFRLGIQKAQEAINNSIGDIANVKLDNKGDLTDFYKQDESKTKKQPRMGYSKPSTKPQEDRKKRKQRKEQSEKQKEVTKQLLGELYADKMYLDKLLKDHDLTRSDTDSGNKIYDLVSEGIDYLDTRTEFWRQQKPMYARKREKVRGVKETQQQQSNKSGKKPVDPTRYILRNLEEIDSAMAEGHAKKALKQAQKVLKMVESWDSEDVPDKQELVANLHSCIGNAYLDLGKMPDALHHHQKDLKISKDNDNEDGKSRALDNLGRVYARIGKFDAAVDQWSQKLPLVKTPLEATWLYHEIGRCHLELGNYQDAKDFGEKSLQSAQDAGDDMWQLNASVLIAQSEVKLGDLQEAIESFERSLEMAKVQGDEPAQGAISKALEELNEKIVKGLQEREAENKGTRQAENKRTMDDSQGETMDLSSMNNPDSHTEAPRSPSASSVNDQGKSLSSHDQSRGNTPQPDQLVTSPPLSKASRQSSRTSEASVESHSSSRKSAKSLGTSQESLVNSKMNVKIRPGSAESNISVKQAVVIKQNDKQDSDKELPDFSRSIDNDEVDGDRGQQTDSGQDDGSTVKSEAASTSTETYHVTVRTSNERGSGTNSNVYITIYGQDGDTGQLQLSDSVDGGNKFESGNTDKFILADVKKVGEITQVRIGHDNRGALAGWKLDSVDIEVRSLGQTLHFPCDMWLDEDEGDGKTERELKPGVKTTETYHVSVKTSDDQGSGTNSNVYIILCGDAGNTGKLELSDSVDGGNKFESGSTDRFILEDVKNIGDITHIKIGHDNRGAFAGWKLESVDVEVPSLSRSKHFPCDMWFDEDEGDSKIERELQPNPTNKESND